MSPRAFQRRDFDELERRRMRAARLLHGGISQAEVARQVKVSRESVRRWANRIAQEGASAALRKAGRRTETAVEWEAVAAVGSDAARGSRESRVPERSMDRRSRKLG